ncbi:hypothetical protein [Paracoccus sp. JM45]|nr:hypothetical protein [Paracoccus sp. JM45]
MTDLLGLDNEFADIPIPAEGPCQGCELRHDRLRIRLDADATYA